ncbi:acyl-CoA synthetase [Haloarcula litorea]|uniref:acyl-CoA synthetase n=1 Tax=Haloarcula litorea TaxID=3032579 RepID=UPI0023E857E5|nr:AMP-binding protein [Halomicroarcula sp. GDY20]
MSERWTRPLGYDLPDPTAGEDLHEGFAWHLPETYNVAEAALSGDASATALRHVDEGGTARSFGYGDLDAASDALAARLAATGVGRGDRVAVCLPTCPELLVAHLGALRLGAVVVPVSMLLGEAAVAHSLSDSGSAVLILDRERADALALDGAVKPDETLLVRPGGYDGDLPALGGLGEHVDPTASVDPVATSPEDPAMLLYTSGTTGDPKGVLQGHRYLAGSLPGYHCWFHLFGPERAAASRVWTPAEWAWAGALFDVVYPTLAVGGTVVARCRRSGFDAARACALLDRERVTHAFAPATALRKLRTHLTDGPTYDFAALDVVNSGGEAVPPDLLSWIADALGVDVNEAYGQTEANALVGNCAAAYPVRPGSMGRPYPGHEVVIVDEAGEQVPPGTVGEVAVEPPDPALFLGYWGDDAATEGAFFANGRFRTGDAAVRDEDGYLWHRGRRDDLIVTSGYRVSPLEVERVLDADEEVLDSVVGGVADETRGQRVTAYVVPRGEGSEALAERLRERVRDELGAYKVPREIEFVDDLPETRSGKVDRAALFD